MIYVFLADGFEETEAIAPIDMLRRAELDVVTVGIKNDAVKSSHGIPVLCDMTDMQVELDERLQMWAQYQQYKPIRQKLDKVKPGKREKYQQEHKAELASFDAAAHFLKSLKESGEAITPKAWRAEAAKLTMQKDADYQKMYAMRDEIKAVENLRKAADRLAHKGQHQQKEQER